MKNNVPPTNIVLNEHLSLIKITQKLLDPKKSAFAPVCTRQAAYEPEAKVKAPSLSPEGSDRDLERAARMPRHL